MTARAIHLENSVPLNQITLELQHLLHVGIGGTKLIDPRNHSNQHDRDRQDREDNLLQRVLFSNKLIIQAL